MLHRRTFVTAALSLTCMPAALRAAVTPKFIPFGIYSQTIFNLSTWIAIEKGFLDAAGMRLTLDEGLTFEEVERTLLDGSRPFAMLGPEIAFLHRDRVAVVAGNANRPPHFLIAQPRFKAVADLRGATFGVISATEGTTNLVRKITAAAGLGPDAYRIQVAGSAPERAKLMDQGRIDAALQPFPLSYVAEGKGFSNLGWVGAAEPDWQFSAFLANRAWLARNPDDAARLLRALVRGRRLMTQDRAAAVEIATRRLGTTAEYARRAVDDCLKLDIIDPNLRWSAKGMAEVYASLQQGGAIPSTTPFTIADFVVAEPLTRALRSARAS